MVKVIHLLLLLISFISARNIGSANAQKTWCVVKPSSDEVVLQQNIAYACSNVDCAIIQNGGACFIPDNLMNHASIAMNLYYQAKGRNTWDCSFGNSGLIVFTDPSYGGCIYA
ncbi:hypothetical protein ABFS82_08G195200 [Erythranthe guttata]|uniref:X8 domain-containing protein n=1 Tax=Erythranthe guttata TaxID=4155 RepID=A0A022QFB1_ERYGU|nr:PREDICTED: major pollen allergen Ole e 10 [Erythranthe guttata]EYU26284.1 hypothetical protein MIMGU_mgv1a016668mg [Erythranthe guttata]|eukprot:XP_012850618.1 PREDICTED: major pollen allergen Ole e 10 [Erythranthe guttata]